MATHVVAANVKQSATQSNEPVPTATTLPKQISHRRKKKTKQSQVDGRLYPRGTPTALFVHLLNTSPDANITQSTAQLEQETAPSAQSVPASVSSAPELSSEWESVIRRKSGTRPAEPRVMTYLATLADKLVSVSTLDGIDKIVGGDRKAGVANTLRKCRDFRLAWSRPGPRWVRLSPSPSLSASEHLLHSHLLHSRALRPR